MTAPSAAAVLDAKAVRLTVEIPLTTMPCPLPLPALTVCPSKTVSIPSASVTVLVASSSIRSVPDCMAVKVCPPAEAVITASLAAAVLDSKAVRLTVEVPLTTIP